jgi:hypothetical protein
MEPKNRNLAAKLLVTEGAAGLLQTTNERMSDVKRPRGQQEVIPTQKGRIRYTTLTVNESANDRHFVISRFADFGPILPNPGMNPSEFDFSNQLATCFVILHRSPLSAMPITWQECYGEELPSRALSFALPL